MKGGILVARELKLWHKLIKLSFHDWFLGILHWIPHHIIFLDIIMVCFVPRRREVAVIEAIYDNCQMLENEKWSNLGLMNIEYHM